MKTKPEDVERQTRRENEKEGGTKFAECNGFAAQRNSGARTTEETENGGPSGIPSSRR